MLCNICKKNEAAVFLKISGKGGAKNIGLCISCAVARGISTNNPPDLEHVESILLEIKKVSESEKEDASKLCPACGKSLLEIKNTETAGCPECYEVFREEIISELKKHMGFEKYSGSMPKRLAGFRNSITDRLDLQAKIEEAVKCENYEKAAVYRDFLRALEHGCVARGENNVRR